MQIWLTFFRNRDFFFIIENLHFFLHMFPKIVRNDIFQKKNLVFLQFHNDPCISELEMILITDYTFRLVPEINLLTH